MQFMPSFKTIVQQVIILMIADAAIRALIKGFPTLGNYLD